MALKEEFERRGNWLFIYRSYLPIGILIDAILVAVYRNLQNKNLFFSSTTYGITSLSIGVIRLPIRVYTVGYTVQNTSGHNTYHGQVAYMLNSTSPYISLGQFHERKG